jgi:hypothetical protein
MIQLSLNNAINRANVYTLAGVEIAFTFNALIGIDFIYHIAFINGLCGANWFTRSARNAVVKNFHRHE